MVESTGAKQICCTVSTIVYPALDFGIKPRGTYTREDFEQVPSRIAFDQEFGNTGDKTVQLDRLGTHSRNLFSIIFDTSTRRPSTLSSMASATICFIFSGRSTCFPLVLMLLSTSTSGASTAQPTSTTFSSPILLSERTEPTALRRSVSLLPLFDSLSPCYRWTRTASVQSRNRPLTHSRSTPARVDQTRLPRSRVLSSSGCKGAGTAWNRLHRACTTE